MIEVYLFLAMFPVQILGMSVLYPVLLTRLIRTGLKNIPAERLAELYPGVDVGQAHERFLARYRAANTVVAVLGLLLLGWFISYMQRHVGFTVVHHRAEAAASGDMGPVRGNCFFPDPHASRSSWL